MKLRWIALREASRRNEGVWSGAMGPVGRGASFFTGSNLSEEARESPPRGHLPVGRPVGQDLPRVVLGGGVGGDLGEQRLAAAREQFEGERRHRARPRVVGRQRDARRSAEARPELLVVG